MTMSINIPAACAAFAWGGVATYFGSAILRGRTFYDITLIDGNLSSRKAAVIGGLAASLALIALEHGKEVVSKYYPGGFYGPDYPTYYRNWTWIAFVPLIAVPYFARVPLMTGVSLVSMVFLAAFAKQRTVGLLS